MTDFMKSRKMDEDIAEDRHLWRLGVDERLLADIYIIIIIINLIFFLYCIDIAMNCRFECINNMNLIQ